MERLAFTILKAAASEGMDAVVTWHDNQLQVGGKAYGPVAETISARGYESRVQLLLRNHNVTYVDIPVLERLWQDALESPRSVGRLLELAVEASSTPFGKEDDLAEWRQRIKLGLIQRNCFYKDDIPPGDPEGLGSNHVELRQVLYEWPNTLRTDPLYAVCEAPFKQFEPLPIDEAWVDLHFVDLSTHRRGSIDKSLMEATENWYRVQQKSSYPPDYLIEKLDGLVVLVGDPGVGKTTFIKWIARRLLANPDGRYLLPLIVPLRRYVQSDFAGSLLQYALKECGVREDSQRTLWASALSYLAGERRERVLLLLDGLDEVPRGTSFDKLLTEIDDLARTFTTVVTSRPSGYPGRLNAERMFEITELSSSSSSKLIDKWFEYAGQPLDRAESLRQHLLNYPDIRRLARNPFLLTLLCGISCSLDSPKQGLPKTRRELYDRTFALLADNDATAGKADTKEGHVAKTERFAFWLFRDAKNAPRYVFDSDDITELFGNRDLLTTFLQPRRLVKQWDPNKETLFFVHTTIHEYLVARFLQDAGRDQLDELLKHNIGDAAWQEVFALLCSAFGEGDSFWQAFSELAEKPDRFGLVDLRLAKLLAELRPTDGGRSILGVDIQQRLWRGQVLDGQCLAPYVNALIELDGSWFAKQCRLVLQDQNPAIGDEHAEEIEHDRNRITGELRTELLRSIRRAEATEASTVFVSELLGDQVNATAASYSAEWLSPSDQKRLRDALEAGIQDEKKRRAVIRAMGVSRDSASIPIICSIADSDTSVRRTAFEALALMGGQEVYRYFDSKLSAENEVSVRAEAIRALGMMGELKARDRLLSELAMTEPGDEMNEALVGALSENPVSSHSDVIVDLLRSDPNPSVRRDAAAVLEHSSEMPVAEELAHAVQNDDDADVCFSAMASLRVHGRKSDINWIEPLVGDKGREPGFRAVALDALMRLAELNPELENRAKGWIATGLQDEDYDVRLTAVVGIGMLGQPFEEECRSIVTNPKEQIETRAAACKSLAQLDDHEAIEILLSTVRSEKNRRVAEAAAEAILEIDPFSLFFDRGEVATNALRTYALSSGCLFYEDKVLNHRGEVIFKSAKGIGKDIPLQFLAIGHDGKDWRGLRLHRGTTWHDLGEVVGITPKQTRLLLALANNKGVLSSKDAVLEASDGQIDASDIRRHLRNISSHFSKAKQRIREAFDLCAEVHPIALDNGEWQARIKIGIVETRNGNLQFIKMGEQ